MWDLFIQNITNKLRVICTILAFAVPYSIYKLNNYLHERGDPPWKKEDIKD